MRIEQSHLGRETHGELQESLDAAPYYNGFPTIHTARWASSRFRAQMTYSRNHCFPDINVLVYGDPRNTMARFAVVAAIPIPMMIGLAWG